MRRRSIESAYVGFNEEGKPYTVIKGETFCNPGVMSGGNYGTHVAWNNNGKHAIIPTGTKDVSEQSFWKMIDPDYGGDDFTNANYWPHPEGWYGGSSRRNFNKSDLSIDRQVVLGTAVNIEFKYILTTRNQNVIFVDTIYDKDLNQINIIASGHKGVIGDGDLIVSINSSRVNLYTENGSLIGVFNTDGISGTNFWCTYNKDHVVVGLDSTYCIFKLINSTLILLETGNTGLGVPHGVRFSFMSYSQHRVARISDDCTICNHFSEYIDRPVNVPWGGGTTQFNNRLTTAWVQDFNLISKDSSRVYENNSDEPAIPSFATYPYVQGAKVANTLSGCNYSWSIFAKNKLNSTGICERTDRFHHINYTCQDVNGTTFYYIFWYSRGRDCDLYNGSIVNTGVPGKSTTYNTQTQFLSCGGYNNAFASVDDESPMLDGNGNVIQYRYFPSVMGEIQVIDSGVPYLFPVDRKICYIKDLKFYIGDNKISDTEIHWIAIHGQDVYACNNFRLYKLS